jgi:hypothetical protein
METMSGPRMATATRSIRQGVLSESRSCATM